jgi:hypothetical protein
MMYGGTPGQNAVNNPGSAGAVSVVARRGVFMYAVNDNSIGQAQVGQIAFAVDDNSVSASDGSGGTVVTAQAVTLPASASAQVAALGHENASKVRVHSTSVGGIVYAEGSDYVIDYAAGLLMLVSGGAIAAASTVYVDYNYGPATRSAAGRIVAIDASGQVWIDFWHQGAAA